WREYSPVAPHTPQESRPQNKHQPEFTERQRAIRSIGPPALPDLNDSVSAARNNACAIGRKCRCAKLSVLAQCRERLAIVAVPDAHRAVETDGEQAIAVGGKLGGEHV